MNKSQKYYVVYGYHRQNVSGLNSCTVTAANRTKESLSEKDLHNIKKSIIEKTGYEDVVIINIIPLSE